MTKRAATIGTVVAVLALLAGIYLATASGETVDCFYTDRDNRTIYTQDRGRIAGNCVRNHLFFPF